MSMNFGHKGTVKMFHPELGSRSVHNTSDEIEAHEAAGWVLDVGKTNIPLLKAKIAETRKNLAVLEANLVAAEEAEAAKPAETDGGTDEAAVSGDAGAGDDAADKGRKKGKKGKKAE